MAALDVAKTMPRPDDDDAQAVALLDRIIGADPDNAGVRAQLQGTMWASPRLLLTAIHEQATTLGIDDEDFHWIAARSLLSPLPDGWAQYKDHEGNPYYLNDGRRVPGADIVIEGMIRVVMRAEPLSTTKQLRHVRHGGDVPHRDVPVRRRRRTRIREPRVDGGLELGLFCETVSRSEARLVGRGNRSREVRRRRVRRRDGGREAGRKRLDAAIGDGTARVCGNSVERDGVGDAPAQVLVETGRAVQHVAHLRHGRRVPVADVLVEGGSLVEHRAHDRHR